MFEEMLKRFEDMNDFELALAIASVHLVEENERLARRSRKLEDIIDLQQQLIDDMLDILGIKEDL